MNTVSQSKRHYKKQDLLSIKSDTNGIAVWLNDEKRQAKKTGTIIGFTNTESNKIAHPSNMERCCPTEEITRNGVANIEIQLL